MKEEVKKKIYGLILVLTLFLSIFAIVSAQYDINVIKNVDAKEEEELIVKIYADKVSGVYPHTVDFKSLVLDENEVKELYWDFGDGEISDEKNPKHIYDEVGNYLCKLIVTDKNGKTKTDFLNISVSKNNPPMVKIVTDKTTGFRPETIHFDANVFDVEGDDVTYEWEIKYPPFFSYERVETYNQKNFSVRFWRYGMYVATLTVTDEAGNSVTEYLRIDIKPSKIEVSINSMLYTLTTLQTAINIIKGIVGAFE